MMGKNDTGIENVTMKRAVSKAAMFAERAVFFYKLNMEKAKQAKKEHVYYFYPSMEITTKIGCLNCEYCPQDSLVKNYRSSYEGSAKLVETMTMANFMKCVNKLPKKSHIDFAGMGEPFLNSECVDMICYADMRGHKISLFTTLIGVQPKTFEKIMDIPFLNIVLHIPDNCGNLNIRVTDDYLNVLDLFLKHRRTNGNPFVTGISCHGYPEKQVAARLKGHGFRKIRPDVIYDRAGNLRAADSIKSAYVEPPFFCAVSMHYNHNVLLPDGRVVLCCMDFSLKHIIGNLLEESYQEIMRGTKMRSIIEAGRSNIKQDILCIRCNACIAYRKVQTLLI